MTPRPRLRPRRSIGIVAGVVAWASLAASAQGAYTPGLVQFDGTAGCAAAAATTGCAQLAAPTAGEGLARDGDDLYLSVGSSAGSTPGLFHFRRVPGGIALQSCVVETPNAPSAPGCAVVSVLPHDVTRPAIADDAVYVGGVYGSPGNAVAGGVAVIRRDPSTGDLTANGATCRAADTTDAPGCVSDTLDRLGSEVVDIAVAPDGSTVHALARSGSETQLVTYGRGNGGALDDVSCLANVAAVCDRPSSDERVLLSGASQLVIAPDGLDAYLASPKGLVHLARVESNGALTVDDCVGDSEDLAGLCDKGPGDFRGVSHLSMADDDQVIAVSYGVTSTSVVRLLRDGSGTLTEAGCIGSVAEDGCGVAAGLTDPTVATATPDGKNVVVAGDPGQPLVTLIAGGVTGLRPVPFGTSGCAAVQGAAAPAGCSADVRGVITDDGPDAPKTTLLAQDDEVIATTHGSFLFFSRGRAPGCIARTTTVARPSSSLPLVCGDPNGDQLAYAIGRAPGHGALGEIGQNPAQVVFTPDDTYEGPDSFTYGAGDGTFTSAAVTYTLTLPAGPNTAKPGTDTAPGKGSVTDGGGTGQDTSPAHDDRADKAAPVDDGASDPAADAKAPVKAPTAGAVNVDAKRLKLSSKRIVTIAVSCRGSAGAAPCTGNLRLAAASRLVVDGKRQVVTFGRKDYVVPAGATFRVNLRLPAKLAALVTMKKPVAATVLAIGTAPSPATPVKVSVALAR